MVIVVKYILKKKSNSLCIKNLGEKKEFVQCVVSNTTILGRTELECPECGKEIEVTTMSRPRRGRKPGSTNAAPLVNPIPPKAKRKR